MSKLFHLELIKIKLTDLLDYCCYLYENYIRLQMQVAVNRKNTKFNHDASRVIARFLQVEDERVVNTIRALLNMSEDEASLVLNQVLRDYAMRHRNISKIFEKHFNHIAHLFIHLNIDPE